MVRMSFLRALLTDAGIDHVVLDTHMSITEGNANFIAPRLMVDSEDYARARRLLDDAGIDDA
jgi:putative signal transducing protein